MSFDVSADAYLRFMGQYSEPLAVQFADLAGVGHGQRVLDVGCGPGALTAELAQAGLAHAQATTLTVRVRHASFEQWWERFTLGVGPAGAYLAPLSPDRRAELREQCRRLLPAGPVEISATAWAVTCQVPRLPASASPVGPAMVFNGLVGVEVRVRESACEF